MKKILIYISDRPALLFLPFLVALFVRIVFSPPTGNSGDETRYLNYAYNLIDGFYSPPAPDIELINGPGYPFLLVPFLWIGAPLIYITFLNAILYYFSFILFFKSLRFMFSKEISLVFGLFWAFYYLGYQNINIIHTESTMCFLVTLLIYFTLRSFHEEKRAKGRWFLVSAGLTLGYIALTRVIFGQVILLMLLGTGILYLWQRTNRNYKKAFLLVLIAFLTTLPYLVYTYNLTGKPLYWGQGNDCLYWMTTDTPNEYGSWFPDPTQPLDPLYYTYYVPGAKDSVYKYHQKDFDHIKQLKGIEKDEEYRNLAIQNIIAKPQVFAKNIVFNIGRMLFQYPFSYGIQRPKLLIVFPLNGILLTLMLFSVFPTILNWRSTAFEVRFMLLIALIYLGGSALVTAYLRMFAIIVPVLLFWIAYMVNNTIRFNPFFRSGKE